MRPKQVVDGGECNALAKRDMVFFSLLAMSRLFANDRHCDVDMLKRVKLDPAWERDELIKAHLAIDKINYLLDSKNPWAGQSLSLVELRQI